jgi:hypothetical protein
VAGKNHHTTSWGAVHKTGSKKFYRRATFFLDRRHTQANTQLPEKNFFSSLPVRFFLSQTQAIKMVLCFKDMVRKRRKFQLWTDVFSIISTKD